MNWRKKISSDLIYAAVYVALKPADMLMNEGDLYGFVLAGLLTTVLTAPITIPMVALAVAIDEK